MNIRMFSYPERLLAWRYLRSTRKKGFISIIAWFSVLGIMLGVATLILVTSLMNGIREEMLANFVGIDGDVTVYGAGRTILGSDALADRIARQTQTKVTPRIEGQVMASANGRAYGTQVLGFRPPDVQNKPRITEHMTSGTLDDFKTGSGVLIGARLAENMGLSLGQGITLLAPEGRATVAGTIPRIKTYPIAGTFKLGMHALDSSLVLMPYDDARVFFALPDAEGGVASALEVAAPSLGDAPGIAARLRESLADQKLHIYDWQESNRSVFNALNIQRTTMVVILTLIILVAAFNIISSLIMLVKEKRRDIAILRTMGASRGSVLRIFLLSGMSLGIAGTGLGLGLGLVAAWKIDVLRQLVERITGQPILVENIYFLSTLPTKTNPMEVLSIMLFSLAVAFLATLYPAWKASSQHPAEALRYE